MPLFRKLVRKLGGVWRSVDARLFGVPFEQYHAFLRMVVCERAPASLLDVGCGEQSPIQRFSGTIGCAVGVDAHAPSALLSRRRGIHRNYIVIDVATLGSAIAPRSFDCVVALDVIEHLTKDDGSRLLAAIEQIARRRVVVFTPNGFVSQPAEPGNPWQLHLSGWPAREMRERGYRTIGIGGWRPLRGAYALPRWWPRPFWERVSLLTQRFFERRPDRAFQILCVKDVDA